MEIWSLLSPLTIGPRQFVISPGDRRFPKELASTAYEAAELDQVIARAQEAKKRLFALSECRCRNLAECGGLLRNIVENAQNVA